MKPLLASVALIITMLYPGQDRAASSEMVRPPLPQTVIDPIRVMFPRDSNSVTIRCLIGTDGRVDRVIEMKVSRLLRPAFEQAVKAWVFEPAYRKGIPIRSTVVIRFDYLVQPQGYQLTSASSEIQR